MSANNVLVAMILWFVSGPILHYFLYARRLNNYDPFGFTLALFLGPFVAWVAWIAIRRERRVYGTVVTDPQEGIARLDEWIARQEDALKKAYFAEGPETPNKTTYRGPQDLL